MVLEENRIKENTASERLVNLDIAKGIGILLVVWAHARGLFSGFIESFHMPFFFFISGMLYKGSKPTDTYTEGKLKRLLIPFWLYNLMFYPVFFILYYWGKWDYTVCLREVSEIITTVNKVPFLGATWFLAALFQVSVSVHIVYCLLRRYQISDWLLLLISTAVMAVGFQAEFPYRLSRTMICSGFYVMGFLYNKYLKTHVNGFTGGLAAAAMLIMAVLLAVRFPSDFSNNRYENKITFMIGAVCASFFFLYASALIAQIRKNILVDVLCYLGKNSIHIVIWQFLAFRFAIILQIVFAGAPMSSLTAFPVYDSSGIWFAVYLFMGVVVSLLIGKIMDRIFLERVRNRMR